MMGNNDQNFRERLPSHYCAECTQVLFDEADVCPNCNESEPGDGWPSIQDGFDPWLGRVLDGRYVLTRSVGKGAAGSVYKANSVAIARDFAVKIIDFKDESSGIDGNQARARLHREIEAIGRLKNPHVVPFYEVLELYDQFVGVVMDYVEGRTLEEVVMRDGPLPIKRALVILRQIANGTHEAHEAGMIHRDLKPDNIMVERMPAGDDFAHILDFGIVRLDDGVSMTQGFLGTPLYASPEQAMAGEIDRRSDIYSLGAILFFVLTGNPPFMSDNVYQILQAHVRKQAPRLSEAFPHRAFPAELEDLVEEMLAKSPTRRPQTLSDVIDRIDEMLDLPVVHEDAPESFEFPILGEQNATLNGDAYDTDGLREDSASVFESNERDRTGPKAAIFRRGGSGNVSRGSVRRLIDQHREKRRASVDTVYQGNTGAHTLGITVPGRAAFGACAPAGDLMLATDDGQVLVVRGGEVTTIDDVRDVRSCALNDTDALVGTGDGHVLAVEPDGSTSVLFQDIREKPMTALALGDDNRTWLAGSESGRLYRCSPTAGRRVWLRIQDGPPIDAVAIADKGNMFAVARRHGELEISSIASPKQPYARIPATGGIRGLTFSEDGHLLAVLDEDDTIQVYLVEQGIPVHTLKDAENHVLTLGFRGEDLLGYFQSDQKMYARHLDRELERSE
jgi:serine/threonine protein kinase